MFRLKSINLTGLGSRMGTERVWDNWVRYFNHRENAQAMAMIDYNNRSVDKTFKWHKRPGAGPNDLFSGDLGYVAYEITEIVTED